MKIISIVGARPQFVKLGPLSRELRKDHEEVIIHTGQHYDHEMSTLFFEQLEIPKPDINLEIGSDKHGAQTGKMLEGLENEMLKISPDLVLSFGDTNSTLAACLAASKLNIASLHIEAGLRSFNRSMPEEINRIVADHTADLLFAPTSLAVNHLSNEGLANKTVLTGDIMADSVEFVQSKIKGNKHSNYPYFLLTLHRPYNVDDPKRLSLLFSQLAQLNNQVIFPIHPRTKKVIESGSIKIPDNFKLIPPQGYIEFQSLVKFAEKIITDSGGLQKEAYIAAKPCITLRSETEWVETIEAGWNILLDIEDNQLVNKINSFQPDAKHPDLYGRNVATKMAKEIKDFFELKICS
ncbi:MAG: UDP-N-acetylglucosamine 2-epimerase (non-hydrolyzing) [Balneola sp.]|jgi:UDP-GlcNAc3NAcA epimerase